ncbi:hypothetical protein [Yersinia aldovae]|uniref:hypothetical protein n=1 Tax=Yersinia aldovae TaxID=29483 RepID=UPI0011A9FA14|nr:hypothetical protein [Yersinia aldovae]
MALNSGGLPKYYCSKFNQLAVKKYNGTYEDGALENLIKEAIEHMKIWETEPYEQNLADFKSQLNMHSNSKDAAYESRQQLYKEALPLIAAYE